MFAELPLLLNAPMNVSLTPTLERFIARKLKSGRYQTASEVVREGLRLLEERDELHRMHLAHARDEGAPPAAGGTWNRRARPEERSTR